MSRVLIVCSFSFSLPYFSRADGKDEGAGETGSNSGNLEGAETPSSESSDFGQESRLWCVFRVNVFEASKSTCSTRGVIDIVQM